jgi:putative radical SAM enzyme (TIGR03279 family)
MRKILMVSKGSLAHRRGLKPGDKVLSINEEPLLDEIDYQALTAKKHVCMLVEHDDGSRREVDFIKAPEHTLGIQFEDSLISNPQTCGNHCLFCFVDQLPSGLRKSLYLKDDDWRLSLLTGNYVTLTNVGDREFSRILRRKASPLYISVHATDPKVRETLLRHAQAGKLMHRLHQLKEAGLSFHGQIVICPDINDGQVLEQSIRDLMAMHPAALSLALVPVGLTRYRDGLSPIRPFDREDARRALDITAEYQRIALQELGTRFVFPADEILCLAGEPAPPLDYYEHLSQIENGVGMLSQFEYSLRRASMEDIMPEAIYSKTILLPCGVSVAPYLKDWVLRYSPKGLDARVTPIINRFFGESVTVTGLICGVDLIGQLKGIAADAIMLTDNMLNSDNALFLDDITPQQLQRELGKPLVVFKNCGNAFHKAMKLMVLDEIKEGVTYV